MSYLDANTINSLTGALDMHFSTFSGAITIWKEPIKIFVSSDAPVYAGFGNESLEANYTFEQISGIYPAKISYAATATKQDLKDLAISIPDNGVRIKVKEDCKDFIENGKTELIQIDGQSYNNASWVGTQNYLGLKYYFYHLQRTL